MTRLCPDGGPHAWLGHYSRHDIERCIYCRRIRRAPLLKRFGHWLAGWFA